jgi:hypothetical protein
MKELKINVPDGYEIDKDKSTFENIVFKKKKELPKSWGQLISVYGFCVNTECEILESNVYTKPHNRNIFSTSQQAKASIALAQLSHLRNVYRRWCDPDWSDGVEKYCIYFQSGELVIDSCFYNEFFLSFQDKETAELFLENFKDLIEQAKPLMS